MTPDLPRAQAVVDKFLDTHGFQVVSMPPAQHPCDARSELITAIATYVEQVRREEARRWVQAANRMELCVELASRLPQWSFPVAQALIPGRDALYLLRAEAGEPPMPDLTSLKAICANADHDHKYISRGECENCQTYVATFSPALIARLLAVVEAADDEHTTKCRELRTACKVCVRLDALTALGGLRGR